MFEVWPLPLNGPVCPHFLTNLDKVTSRGMKQNFDKHRDVWGPLFTMQLQQWADTVFQPASKLIDNDIMHLPDWGIAPVPFEQAIGGKDFSQQGISLHLSKNPSANYDRVKYFDYAAGEYEMATHRYKKHIVEHSFRVLKNYLRPDSRVLEIACGPGYEAIAISMLVPESEVVALDLSKEMIRLACRNAKQHLVNNMTFYQADAQSLPGRLRSKFDIIYCQLNCSYFDDLHAVAKMMFHALYSQGMVFLVEPFPNLANSLSITPAKAANPYFEKLYGREELKAIFLNAGFADFYWKEILPGIGISIISKIPDVQ